MKLCIAEKPSVAKEIAKEAGTAAEFGEMNRIQQEAIAKAVGMNRDELVEGYVNKILSVYPPQEEVSVN